MELDPIRDADQILINDATVAVGGYTAMSLARYQDWFVAAYTGPGSYIRYMFGDAAGWNGNRALPVIPPTRAKQI